MKRGEVHLTLDVPMTGILAEVELVATLPGGEPRPLRVWLGAPAQVPSGEWCCPAGLDGLYDNLQAMRGEDALQAICLALGLCASLLRGHLADGGRLQYPTGDDFPLEAYFGWQEPPAPAP